MGNGRGFKPRGWDVKFYLITSFCAVIYLLLAVFAITYGYAKTWDRTALIAACEADTGSLECVEARKRNKFLSEAGTLPTYKDGQPTGETYKGSCCGQADAYEADAVVVDPDGSVWAVLTCNDEQNCKPVCTGDPDEGDQTCRVQRPTGSRWRVPPEKVLRNYDPINDTGHGWVYISPNSTLADNTAAVLCWAAPAGS